MASDYGYALALGALGAYMTIILFLGLALLVMLIVGHWKMFTKAGEAGWKSLVPLYSDYVLFKLVWNTRSFWIYLVASLITGAISAITYSNPSSDNFVFGAVSFVASTVVLIYSALCSLRTAESYGKSNVFAVGLLFLPSIFTIILGFGSARYHGPSN